MKTGLFYSLVLSLYLFAPLIPLLYGAPGELDPSFGVDGMKAFGFGGSPDSGVASAAQSDGKLVVVGISSGHLTLIRFGTNQLPDPTFGNEGTVSTSISPTIRTVRIQADGKIVVAGRIYQNGNDDLLLVRYNPDGTLDDTFNGTGILTRDFGAQEDCTGFLIDLSGRMVVVGNKTVPSFPGGTSQLLLARFQTNGLLDSTFNSVGYVTEPDYSRGYAVMLQGDGKLLVAGYKAANCVLRYHSNGTPDTDFANAGRLVIPAATQLHSLATQPGNGTINQPDRYIVAGGSSSGGQNTVLLARFDGGGALDSAFNGTGVAHFNVGQNAEVKGLFVLGTLLNRYIYFGGSVSVGGQTHLMAAKVNLAGAFHPDFGVGGVATTNVSPGYQFVNHMIIYQGGLLLTGTTYPSDYYAQDIELARFRTSDGALDTNFFGSGYHIHNVGDLAASAKAVAIQNDGKIIVAGSANTGPYTAVAVARLHQNGSFDTNFGVGGVVIQSVGTENSEAAAVAIQPDGRIVIGGSAYDGKYSSVMLARFQENGELDGSFGTNGIVITRVGTNSSSAAFLRFLSGGRILVGGGGSTASDLDFLVMRYLDDGLPDPTWNGSGRILTAIGTDYDQLSGLAVLPDGKVIAAGSSSFVGGPKMTLARYTTNGVLDNSFGSFGRQSLSFGIGAGDAATAVAQQGDAKLVLAGYTLNTAGTDADIAVARLTTNGVFDSTFDGDGKVVESIGLSIDYGVALALQNDGRILVGSRTQIGSELRFGVLRLLPGGAVDTDYGFGGRNYFDFGTGDAENLNALAIDSIGRTVMAGDVRGLFGVLRIQGDTPAFLNFISITRLDNGHMLLNGTGVPEGSHSLLKSTNVAAGVGGFSFLASVTADSQGNWQFEDSSATATGNCFYRLSFP